MKINLSPLSANNSKLKLVKSLIKLFANDNDIKMCDAVRKWTSTPAGAKAIANWANAAGFKISYWCMEPLKSKSNYNNETELTWIGFGLDIDETCPKIIEINLKNID